MKTKKNMKNPIALKSILTLALGAFLTQSPALAGPAVNGSGEVTHTEVNTTGVGGPVISTGVEVEGASAKIHRNDKAVTINIKTAELNPHHVYTVWIFELDANGPVGPPQLLTGRIVGGSGKATFTGRSKVQDSLGGEFHCIMADHGPKDPSSLPDEMRRGVAPFITDPVTGELLVLNWHQVAVFLP